MVTRINERYRRTKPLIEGGVYSLALTCYQYIARGITHQHVKWLLIPMHPDIPLISGPAAYVTHEGRIGVSEGLTDWSERDLDFTGRVV